MNKRTNNNGLIKENTTNNILGIVAA